MVMDFPIESMQKSLVQMELSMNEAPILGFVYTEFFETKFLNYSMEILTLSFGNTPQIWIMTVLIW